MPKIYISGPMRGYLNYNFDAFDAADKKLSQEGWTVINPACIDRMMEGWEQYPPVEIRGDMKRFIRRDINLLLDFDPRQGDAICMLPGYEKSKGSMIELAIARFLNLDVWHIDIEPCGSYIMQMISEM